MCLTCMQLGRHVIFLYDTFLFTFFVPGDPIKYDPDFQGPIHNRSCTDILWLILFLLFLGVWGFVGYYSE